jgi:catechol 2,3-dioxygenase-like lactoylglutathione lyase family enzyme
MRIGLTSIYVDDQDQAERFYTEVLGLQVKTSAPYGPGERWLSVVAPEDPGGVELALHLADEPARTFQAASRAAGRPVLSLHTDDFRRDAERLKAKGVVFVTEPRGTAAVARPGTPVACSPQRGGRYGDPTPGTSQAASIPAAAEAAHTMIRPWR